jgi:hypothetical protein
MKKIICLSLTLLCVALGAIPISRQRADALAETMLDSRMQNQHIARFRNSVMEIRAWLIFTPCSPRAIWYYRLMILYRP